MSLFKAKVVVEHDGKTYQPGETFEVSAEDATAKGYDVENETVEPVPAA